MSVQTDFAADKRWIDATRDHRVVQKNLELIAIETYGEFPPCFGTAHDHKGLNRGVLSIFTADDGEFGRAFAKRRKIPFDAIEILFILIAENQTELRKEWLDGDGCFIIAPEVIACDNDRFALRGFGGETEWVGAAVGDWLVAFADACGRIVVDSFHDGVDLPVAGDGRPDAPLFRLLFRAHEVVAEGEGLKPLVVKLFNGRLAIGFCDDKLSFQFGERDHAAKPFARRQQFQPNTMAADDERRLVVNDNIVDILLRPVAD